MNSSRPLVSILIRSSARPELAKALDSIAAQTYSAIEVIVVNASGSLEPPRLPPGCPFALRLLAPGQPLQRSVAANALLEAATGDWGLFLDDDDWLAPNHVERLAAVLQANPQLAAAYGGVSCVEATAADTDTFTEVRRFDEPHDPTRLMIENYIPINAALFDLRFTRLPGGPRFDPDFDLYEDWDFWLQLLATGPFQHVAGIGAYYRIHGSSGVGVRMDQADQAEAALDQLIHKWRDRWSVEALHSLFGLGRQFFRQQAVLAQRDATITQIQAELDEARTAAELARQALQTQKADYENSRSWRLTRPLRAIGRRAKRLRQASPLAIWRAGFFRGVLALATRAYQSPAIAPLARLVPSAVKRRVRNALMLGTHLPGLGIEAGVRVMRALGPTPRVSIIIPVYNHARYIEQCIRSALAQNWETLEVVVVNDASPDPRVREILDSLQGQPRLRIQHNPQNLGICQTQNRALTLCSGDVIAFLDCDDYLTPEAIAICMRAWRDDVVYLHTGRLNVDEEGREINRINFLSLPRQDYFTENLNAMYATHLKLVRRDVFARVGLFDPRFDSAQDYELLMRVAFHYPSSSFVHVPDFVYSHRLHAEQTTETQRARQNAMTRRIQDEARLREGIRHGRYERFLSFIMLSYGKHTQTLRAIEGLKATVHVPHEVILYDNGSSSDTVTFLKEHIDGRFDNVRVFYGDRNLGPAQGRRVALEHARGEWVVVFDNDEIPEPGWLEELLVRAQSTDNVGAVCCRVAFPDKKLQFSGGLVVDKGDGVIDLALHDRGAAYDDLSTCAFREVDWCPIGATLFTRNVAPYLHEGYPNTFEDAGVSFALRKQGLRLLNAPGALVWHDHITFQPKAEMHEQYMRDRYNPKLMLKSIASFHRENGLLIHDEYIWRENGLPGLARAQLLARLDEALAQETRF